MFVRIGRYLLREKKIAALALLTSEIDTPALLYADRKHRIWEIVASLLYYALNKPRPPLPQNTEQAVEFLLDHVATYPNENIVYQPINPCAPRQMQDSSMKPIHASERVPTSSSQSEDDPFPCLMVPFSLLPKSLSLLWHRPPNQS